MSLGAPKFYKQISVNGEKYNIYAEYNCEVDGHTAQVMGIDEEKGYMWINWDAGIKVVGDDGEEKGDYEWNGVNNEIGTDEHFNDIQDEVREQWGADGGTCIDSPESLLIIDKSVIKNWKIP